MRILVADALEASAVDALRLAGHEVVVEAELTADDLPTRIPGFDGLIVRSTRVSAAALASGKSLQLVVRAGAGTNTIDCEAATAHRVCVTNVPGRNALAVAELTLGLMLAVDRRIPDGVIALREGRWDKKGLSQGARGLAGSTLGILGLGSIGLAVAERARAFGMSLASLQRPGRSPEMQARITGLGIRLVASQPELAAESDILTVHIPGGSRTVGVVDDETLDAMRPGSILVNTSRADVVDNEALLRHLDAGRLRAGLDVYPDEPTGGRAEWTSRLAAHPAVVGTHHVGASTQQAQHAVADGVVEVVAAFVAGEPVHLVNPAAWAARGEPGAG